MKRWHKSATNDYGIDNTVIVTQEELNDIMYSPSELTKGLNVFKVTYTTMGEVMEEKYFMYKSEAERFVVTSISKMPSKEKGSVVRIIGDRYYHLNRLYVISDITIR